MAAGLIVIMTQEWIIIALCLGVGGHIALGVVMHAPGFWPWSTTGLYSILCGLAVYGLVQGARVFWKLFRQSPKLQSKNELDALW
jgi:hypothetical protein